MFGFHEPIPHWMSTFISPTCNHSVNLAHGKDPLQSGLRMCNVYVLMNILGQSREEWNSFASAKMKLLYALVVPSLFPLLFWSLTGGWKGSVSSVGVPLCPLLLPYSHLLLIVAGAASDLQPCCDAVTWGWHQRCTVKTRSPSCRTCDVSAEWLMLQSVSVDLFPTSCLRGKHPLP